MSRDDDALKLGVHEEVVLLKGESLLVDVNEGRVDAVGLDAIGLKVVELVAVLDTVYSSDVVKLALLDGVELPVIELLLPMILLVGNIEAEMESVPSPLPDCVKERERDGERATLEVDSMNPEALWEDATVIDVLSNLEALALSVPVRSAVEVVDIPVDTDEEAMVVGLPETL